MKRKTNVRKIYEKFYGKIDKDLEVHHIIPVFDGGSDDIENLVCLTKEEHKLAHLERYKKYGNFRDLCSYYMIGYNFSEAHRISSSEGGKKGGSTVKQMGVGIFGYDRSSEEYRKIASSGGSNAQKTLRERQISAFYDPKLRAEICRKGGLSSSAFKDPKRQSEYGKRGGVKNRGKVYVTDGLENRKVQPEDLENFLSEHGNFRKGRTRTWRK